jgi:hypothetical protein
MPFKFWKKEKPAEKAPEKPPEEVEPADAPPEPSPQGSEPASPEVVVEPATDADRAAPAPVAVAVEADPAAVIGAIHDGLVELGLVARPTREVFRKRVEAFPGGLDAFLRLHEREPWKATTLVLGGWLALRARPDFDPERLLAELNPRLSSFGLSIALHGLSWLDQELGLRKGKIVLGDREKIVRFKDPRDFLRGVNDLVAAKSLAVVELETWSDELAFLLVRDPRWSGLAETDLVVVKDPQTATADDCPECGAKLGKHWNDCLSCGAMFA